MPSTPIRADTGPACFIPGKGPSLTANPHQVTLDAAAQAFVEAADAPPHLHDLGPARSRDDLDTLQRDASDIDVSEHWVTINSGPTGSVRVRVVTPPRSAGSLPVVVYLHGGGWVSGSAHTHDRLIRELAVQSGAAVMCPEYTRSPEARYPVALEQVYATAQWVVADGARHGLDGSRMAVAGDSAGGNMAIALTWLSLQRADFHVRQLVAFYPVTDAAFDTDSYHTFATGYHLRRDSMQWLWDQYTADAGERAMVTASPLRAESTQFASFPPSLIITAEADVLRDEGEAFAAKLRFAGVPTTAVRYEGTIHDFVMLNALKDTTAAKAATAQAASALKVALGT